MDDTKTPLGEITHIVSDQNATTMRVEADTHEIPFEFGPIERLAGGVSKIEFSRRHRHVLRLRKRKSAGLSAVCSGKEEKARHYNGIRCPAGGLIGQS
jgi:hypothetical protein